MSVLSNRNKDSTGGQAKVVANATWHTDHTNQERPPKFTMLYPVALPDKGGGTSVCNMRAAYEALPEGVEGAHHRPEDREHAHQQRTDENRQSRHRRERSRSRTCRP